MIIEEKSMLATQNMFHLFDKVDDKNINDRLIAIDDLLVNVDQKISTTLELHTLRYFNAQKVIIDLQQEIALLLQTCCEQRQLLFDIDSVSIQHPLRIMKEYRKLNRLKSVRHMISTIRSIVQMNDKASNFSYHEWKQCNELLTRLPQNLKILPILWAHHIDRIE